MSISRRSLLKAGGLSALATKILSSHPLSLRRLACWTRVSLKVSRYPQSKRQ